MESPKVFIDAKYASTSLTTEYTSTGTATISRFTATNVSASNATIEVHLVPNGQSTGRVNTIVTRTLAPYESYVFPELVGHALELGDYIACLGGTASAIVLRASGRLIV